MTYDEIKRKIRELGTEAAQEIEQRIEEEKAKLDTETRRKVRAFWAPVGFVTGFLAAYLVQLLS
jgi:hypothetical protein